MISVNLEQATLLSILKKALFDLSSDTPDYVNWDNLLEYAKAQCIVPLIAANVPSEHSNEWCKISYQYKAHLMQMIYTQNSLVKLLTDNDIPFIILKGTAAAIYYPQPLLRSFGDIDLYVSENSIDDVLSLFKANRYVYVTNNDRHYEFEKDGIDIELHSRFSCDYYKDIDPIILEGLNNAVKYNINGCFFPGLPSCENGLVLLGHIMQHLKGSGIGLRQIIDWMMFVHKVLDDETWEACFEQLAIKAGLEKLAKNVTFMCRKWLGLPNKITWCNDADEDIADQLLIYILEDGNLGQERPLFEIIKNSMKEEGAYAYLQRVGLEKWALAQKHGFFKPFAWLYQLCRYFFLGMQLLFTNRKMFFRYKHEMNREELWKRLE